MEEIINRIFTDIIPIICNGIDEKYWNIIKQEYIRILHNRYSEIDKKLNTEDYDELYNSLYESELEEWSNISPSMKKSLLIKDEPFEEIINISNKSFGYAEERNKNGKIIDKEKADTYITKLNLLLKQIDLHNKTAANWHVQESVTDLKYASNQSDNISIRIGHNL